MDVDNAVTYPPPSTYSSSTSSSSSRSLPPPRASTSLSHSLGMLKSPGFFGNYQRKRTSRGLPPVTASPSGTLFSPKKSVSSTPAERTLSRPPAERPLPPASRPQFFQQTGNSPTVTPRAKKTADMPLQASPWMNASVEGSGSEGEGEEEEDKILAAKAKSAPRNAGWASEHELGDASL